MEKDFAKIKNWYALYTKSRHEFIAEKQIENEGITCYLPTTTQIRKWSDRKKKITEPLFKGYLFVYATEKERILAVQITSIIKTIFFNGKPATIPPNQIESLKKMLEITNDVEVLEKLVEGNRIKVIEGPFKGVEGVVFTISKNQNMLAITVEMLNRSVVVNLPVESVIKKKEGKYL
ncbi:UpxY family transcription antiterminator [Bacteroidota bacterium]